MLLDFLILSGAFLLLFEFGWPLVALIFLPLELGLEKLGVPNTWSRFFIRGTGHYILFGIILGFAAIGSQPPTPPAVSVLMFCLVLVIAILTCFGGVATLEKQIKEANSQGRVYFADDLAKGRQGVVLEAIAMPILVLIGLFIPGLFLTSFTLTIHNWFVDIMNVPVLGWLLRAVGGFAMIALFVQYSIGVIALVMMNLQRRKD